TAADPTYQQDVRRTALSGDLSKAYGKDAMSVGEDYAEKHGVKVGDTLTVAFKAGETAKLKVAAITSDDTNIDRGAMYANLTTAASYVPADRMPQNVAMFGKAEEGKEKEAYAALKSAMAEYPVYKVQNQADFKEDL
ncbi:hypothetical protein G3M58_33260, partial [Streptomyces sp. SID7499]|nr:hypothetical protein [Streptomyces sp. SID7499]